MARFRFRCIASLTIACVTATAPLKAEESGVAVLTDCPCPPGQAPSFEYPAPSSEYQFPAPAQPTMKVPPSPKGAAKPSDAPPASQPAPSDTPAPNLNQELSPNLPQAPNFNTQAPQMATPTFMPSSMPTTAASSAQPTVPNMIGDLFGTSFSGAVPVVIDNFFAGTTDIDGIGIDPMSTSRLTASELSLLGIFRQDGTMIATVNPFTTSFTTTMTQAEIAASGLLAPAPVPPPFSDFAPGIAGSGAIPIENNAFVDAEVAAAGAAIHGPGETSFLAGRSAVFLQSPNDLMNDYDAFWNYDYIIWEEAAGLSNPGGAPGAMVGRQKLTENSS
ncbi:MAG: hypothetical protein KF861_15065, partial [Planctomycetaceae bacterium]|nr:hypothetical protein [Planctomycetaceae bacterium]